MSTLLNVFCCYAREDRDMLQHLKKHLMFLKRSGKIDIWSDTDLDAGIEWKKELHHHLESADIILLLISPYFMASDYCYSTEMGRAIERHDEGSAVVIPILLRSIHWEDAPFAELQVVPTNAVPVTNWSDRDDAFRDITKHISRVTLRLQKEDEDPTRAKQANALEERYMSYLLEFTLAELFRQLAGNQDDQTMQEVYDRLDLLTTTNIEEVLGTLLDPMAFPDLQEFAQGLKRAYLRVQKDNVTSEKRLGFLLGAIGLVCFTVELLNISQQQSQNASSVDLDWPKALIREPVVRHWFKEVYQPSHNSAILPHGLPKGQIEENLKVAEKHWYDLHFDSLELYCVGTTSFILHCSSGMLAGEHLILKCLLFPYTRVPEIVNATRYYALKYPAGSVPATARIRSSTDKWILMDEVVGVTLREFLQRRRAINGQKRLLLDIDLLVSIGKPLLTALHELSCAGFSHEDLTPSNIMIVENNATVEKIVLIDLGRNYLYTRDIGLEVRREAIFVAPEIKDGQNSTETSDLYSFGMILIELADPNGALGGTIPDNLYRYVPDLARFIEDLIDANPENRRLLFPLKDKSNPFASLQSIFADVLKVLPSEREVQLGKFQIEQYIALFYPIYQLARVRELQRMTRASSAHPAFAKQTGRLYGWLLVSLINRWLIFVISTAWGMRDLGITAFLASITIIQTLIPIPSYHFGIENLPARLISFSVGLMQIFYSNILAGLTVRSISGRLAFITECFLRFVTFVAFPLVLIINLLQPTWWPLWLSVGLSVVALTEILCYQLAVRILKKAQGVLSTVPFSALDDPSLKTFGQWGNTLSFYLIGVVVIWVCLQINLLHDLWAYTMVALCIHIPILCVGKCITLAPNVRGSLCRAFTAGERLEYLDIREP